MWHQSPTMCASVSKNLWIGVAYLQKPTLMSATPCYNPDTSNTGSGFQQVDKRHGGCPTQELHAQIRKVSLWIFPARLLMRPGACSPPSCAHLCISVLCADWSLLGSFQEFPHAKKFLFILSRCPWFAIPIGSGPVLDVSFDSITTWRIWPERVPGIT